jgi:hypothetical protein
MNNRTPTLGFAALVLAVAAVLVGCQTSGSAVTSPAPQSNPAGDIPDNQAFVAGWQGADETGFPSCSAHNGDATSPIPSRPVPRLVLSKRVQ